MKFWKKKPQENDDDDLEMAMKSFEIINKACDVFQALDKNLKAIASHYNKFTIPNIKKGQEALQVMEALSNEIKKTQADTLKMIDTKLNGLDAGDLELL